MFDRKQQEEVREAIEANTIGGCETHTGECVAMTLKDDEVCYKWRNGEAVVSAEKDGIEREYTFRIRVELVSVV